MGAKVASDVHLKSAHVLFIDAVGYSKLLARQQKELVERLTAVVREVLAAQRTSAKGRVIRIPTGDGMALVFFRTPVEPVECAIEIARALKGAPDIRVRMGVHSGAVHQVRDVNAHANVAGVGINVAERVMSLADAGHILVTSRVAVDLFEDDRWHTYLHELGEVELKHGVKVGIVNVYDDEIGNPEIPSEIKRLLKTEGGPSATTSLRKRMRRPAAVAAAFALVLAFGAGLWTWRARSFATQATTKPLSPEKSVAVLPFDNMSADQDSAFFSDGVHDEIVTTLAKIADLKVISRTSVLQYKRVAGRNIREIAKALGVANVLEGSVHRSGQRIRVTAQLIDARTATHLWAERYDRDLADVFAIQSEIAEKIARQLQAKLSPHEQAAIKARATSELGAYDLYLRAQALFADTTDTFRARQKLPQAIRLLNEAVARDPQFLLAWCLLAKVHGDTYWYGYDPTPARLEAMNAAVQAALRLNRDAGEGRLVLAKYYYQGFRDYGRARAELARARETLPNAREVFEYTGYIDRREGKWQEATTNFERALALDPQNVDLVQQLADTYKAQRRYADATRLYDHVLAIVPGDPGNLRVLRAQVAIDWRADVEPFQAALAATLAEDASLAPEVDGAYPMYALSERSPAAAARFLASYPHDGAVLWGFKWPYAYWEGVIARWQGDEAKAQAAFAQARAEVEKTLAAQPDFPAALTVAGLIDAGLGRKEDAIREGRRACELLPIAKDALDGAVFAVNLAVIYAWCGEKDLALEQIAALQKVPNNLSYGLLKLHPYWDSVRGDPRFDAILASLRPES